MDEMKSIDTVKSKSQQSLKVQWSRNLGKRDLQVPTTTHCLGCLTAGHEDLPALHCARDVLGEQEFVRWKNMVNPESSDHVGRLYCLVTSCIQCHASHEARLLIASHCLSTSTPKPVG